MRHIHLHVWYFRIGHNDPGQRLCEFILRMDKPNRSAFDQSQPTVRRLGRRIRRSPPLRIRRSVIVQIGWDPLAGPRIIAQPCLIYQDRALRSGSRPAMLAARGLEPPGWTGVSHLRAVPTRSGLTCPCERPVGRPRRVPHAPAATRTSAIRGNGPPKTGPQLDANAVCVRSRALILTLPARRYGRPHRPSSRTPPAAVR